jgi:hypothetical protein
VWNYWDLHGLNNYGTASLKPNAFAAAAVIVKVINQVMLIALMTGSVTSHW